MAGLSELVQRGNELTSELLAHLAEVDERMLHLELGFPSLHAYCVQTLGMSEGAAGRRVAAARVCRRFPKVFELVARGDLHLSALCALAPHLNSENADELLAAGFIRPRSVGSCAIGTDRAIARVRSAVRRSLWGPFHSECGATAVVRAGTGAS